MLKRLRTGRTNGTNKKNNNVSAKLERRCQRAYYISPGIGYIGTKYTYQNIGELIGCKSFFQAPNEGNKYRILKCIGSDLSAGIERAIFKDHSVTRLLSHDDLQLLGYSKILE